LREIPDTYPVIPYEDKNAAKKVFLRYYCGQSRYSRKDAAYRAGIPIDVALKWFKNELGFMTLLEKELKRHKERKPKIREHVVEKAIQFVEAKITDCFHTDPITGELSLLSFDQIPEGTKIAIKKLKIVRQRVQTKDGKAVYSDVLDIELHDSVKALGLLGEWAGVKAEEKRQLGDNAVQITGLTLLPPPEAKPTRKELPNAESNEDGPAGEIQPDEETDGGASEAWMGE